MPNKKIVVILLLLVLILLASVGSSQIEVYSDQYPVEIDGWYSSMEEVACYLKTFGKLPGNYISKREAQNLGWGTRTNRIWDIAYGKSIGGDRFGNYQGLLPETYGRRWNECDIDFKGSSRGSKRIVFSNDGLIYYTSDHYSTFEKIVVIKSEKMTSQSSPDGSNNRAVEKKIYVKLNTKYGEIYSDRDSVAAYIFQFHELPINYISLEEAKEIGFSSKRDNMQSVAPEFTIGGGAFENREKLLPMKSGRTWTECDVDIVNGKRGTHRIVFSNDGLVYFTADKFKSFTEMEGIR